MKLTDRNVTLVFIMFIVLSCVFMLCLGIVAIARAMEHAANDHSTSLCEGYTALAHAGLTHQVFFVLVMIALPIAGIGVAIRTLKSL